VDDMKPFRADCIWFKAKLYDLKYGNGYMIVKYNLDILCGKSQCKRLSPKRNKKEAMLQTSKGRSFSTRTAPTLTSRSAHHHLVAHTCQPLLGSSKDKGEYKAFCNLGC
jgi:hypothetical protein